MLSLVAPTDSTVLLLGETGTGKEVAARSIHQASKRKGHPMISVNCGALPAQLIESELFGHEKGSFTGAFERRIGKFELAHQGTIFLDEIGEMPPELQVKLLRVLQERQLERVGGSSTLHVDVRIIAATNRDLSTQVSSGAFRADLYYRLNVFPITLPPLRERIEDIPGLVDFFLSKSNPLATNKSLQISENALAQLCSYSWPGNVRELQHVLERSLILSAGGALKQVALPEPGAPAVKAEVPFEHRTLLEVEKHHIINVLRRCGGRISGKGGAAGYLGLPSTTLHAKMKKLGIFKGDYA